MLVTWTGTLEVVVVVDAETSHSAQDVGSALYGQLETVGSQEVIVTSTVSVMVVVPAATRATKPARANVERILIDLVVDLFGIPEYGK